MIPDHIAVTYCKTCEHAIQTGGLCLMGCQWDANTSRTRPVVVVTYWRLTHDRVPATGDV